MKRKDFIRYGASGALAGFSAKSGLKASDLPDNKIITSPWIRTPVCEMLKIQYPIIQAGMADVAGPELVAAVSNAGGLGILTATMVAPDVLKARINRIRELTDKPFGVNLILHQDLFPPADFEIEDMLLNKVQQTLNGFRSELGIEESYAKPPKLPPLIQIALDIIIEEKIPVFSIGLGNPSAEIVKRCHDNGTKVMAMVSTVEDAISVSGNGVDIIVAQGSEAGGHRSTWEKKESKEQASIGTLPLTNAIVRAVKVPVIAAGGIVNGKGLKAVLALDAQGVLIGTRFIATKESMAPESYKQKILNSSSDETIVTDMFTGMYARVLKNRFTTEYKKSQTPVLPPGRQFAATFDITRESAKQDNPEYYSLYAGQGIDGIREILPAAEVILRIVAEAEIS